MSGFSRMSAVSDDPGNDGPMQPPETTERDWRRVIPLVVVAVVALCLPVLGVVGLFDTLRDVAAWLRDHGMWTAPLYAVVTGVLVGLAVLPTHGVNLLTGFIYGMVVGIPAAMGSVVVATGVGHTAGRWISPQYLRRVVGRRRTGRALLMAMVDTTPGRATLAVILLRLAPQLPFAMGNVLAAAVGVRLLPFLVGTLVGMLPRVVVVVWLGAQLRDWDLGVTSPAALLTAVAAAVIGLGGLTWWAYRVLQRLPVNDEA